MSSSRTENLIEVVMPQMGVSVAEGTVTEWLKAVGESVAADETLCVLTTDKIDVEVPSPAAGVLEAVLVDEGTTVPVGTVLASISTDSSGLKVEETEKPEESPDDSEEIDRSRFYSPVVRRIAEEYGVNLREVEGHGVGGRVRKADLAAFIDSGGVKREKAERVLHSDSPYRPDPEPEREVAVGERREPLSPMRKAIGEHMVSSLRTAAHCTTVMEVDFSAVAARRAELKEAMGRRGVNPTYLAFVALATVEALGRFPVFNSSIEGDEVVFHEDVDLGIAVALEEGLIVPVIRQAQRLSLEGMAAAIGELATGAREGKLSPDDVRGGTFTITNPGQFGAVVATPIINQPQVAILDLEAVVRRPVVVPDDTGGEAIAVRPVGNLCMSWDHRAVDGADAARFLGAIRERVEEGVR